MTKQRVLMIQPGAMGDIFICAPIAKWYYDAGYEVVWPVRDALVSTVEALGYVTTFGIGVEDDLTPQNRMRKNVQTILAIHAEEKFDYVLNLADRGPHPVAQRPDENFEQVKYRLSNVPFEVKHALDWCRSSVKEDWIYNRFVNLPGHDRYAFVHNDTSRGSSEVVELPEIDLPIVFCEEVEGYTIFDWYTVILQADEVYVTESSVFAFCDGIVDDLPSSKFLLPRSTGITSISSNWDKRYILPEQIRING